MTDGAAKGPDWPSSSLQGLGQQLATPVVQLLQAVRDVDRTDAAGNVTKDTLTKVSAVKGTPESVQVITAGATAFSKWWAGAVAAAGGLGAVGTVINQGLAQIVTNAPLLFSLAIVISATLLSIALIVKSDVTSRAEATKARKQSRSTIVEAFLNNYQFARPDPGISYQSNYAMRKEPNGEWQRVEGLVYDSGMLKVKIDNELVAADHVKDILDLRVVAEQLRAGS